MRNDRRALPALLRPISALLALLLTAACCVCLTACGGVSETKIVLTVGGVEITEDDYRYVCMKNMAQYFGRETVEKDLTDEMRKTLKAAVETELRSYCAVETLAKKEGLELTSPEESQIRAEIQRRKLAYATAEDFEEEMKAMYLSEHVLFLQMRNEALEEKLYDKYSAQINGALTDEQLQKDIKEYCYAASQILLISENAVALLQKLRANITDAESFYVRMQDYSVDSVKGVRVCIVGEMIEEFERAALALKIGEISKVLPSSVGAHIILREELTNELIAERLDELREKDIVRIFREKLKVEAAELTIEYENGGEMILE